ncbi:MAG: 3D domain-containing protein [Verrucomicrobiales bacterium]|nr:3D domain-containing protein [Verrucomicrobiota bacterium JB025]
MLARITSLLSIALAAALFTSCGGTSGLHVLSDSATKGHGGSSLASFNSRSKTSTQLPAPSESLLAAAKSKPKDKHSMPIYSYQERRRVVRTTAYTHTESDHLKYGAMNATGTPLRYNNRVRSAAADWSFYPVGTTFRIKGMPYLYVVDDYGSALTGTGTIDIFKPSREVMNLWGRRTVEINIVQWGSFDRSAELLSKRTGYSHCRQMLANLVRQKPELGKFAKR